MSNHNLTVSGGTEKSKYLFSLGYFDQEGTLIETYLKRYSARINTEYKIKKNIKIGENLYVFYKQNPGFANMAQGNAISNSYRMMPIIPAYDIEGNFGGTFAGPGLGNASSPVAIQKRTVNDRNNVWDVVGNVYAEIDFLKNFTARTSFGGTIDNRYVIGFNFNNYNNSEGNTNLNSLRETSLYNTSSTWTNTLSYSNHFGTHSLKMIAGSEAIRNYGRSLTGSSQQFFSTNFDYLTIGNGTTNVTTSSTAYINTLFSLFGRLDYAYDDKYLFGGTIRRDGSSKFGSKSRFGIFPSFSLGWRVSKENFMKNVSWLNDLKIRGSYGILGSEINVNPTNAFSLYGGNFTNAYYDIAGTSNSIQQGMYQINLGNPQARWEQDIITNIGFDATILKKINVSLEYYQKSINGLLFPLPLPYTAGGASAPIVNIGNIKNTGVDVSIVYNDNITDDLQFSVGTNITTYNNEVVKVPDPGYFDVPSELSFGSQVRNKIGWPVSSFYGYDIIGLFKDDAEVAKSPTQNAAAPGRFKYRDVNGDGKITADDRTFLGSPNPDFTYGLNIKLSYKNFDFSSMFYGSQGNSIFNTPRNLTDFFGTFVGGKSTVLLNAWTPENTNTKIPKIEGTSTFSTSSVPNSYYIEDGSYLRLRSLILGYTIKPDILQHLGLSKVRIYLQGANLFTITKYSGLDPELGGSSSEFGVDRGNYPNNQKSFIVGLNVSF
jgi:TonB-linked SusC/RagA family outer membrane protein